MGAFGSFKSRAAQRAYNRARYASAEGEKIRARTREWAKTHRDHVREYERRYRKEHPVKARRKDKKNRVDVRTKPKRLAAHMVCVARHRAKRKKLAFDLTNERVAKALEKGVCEVTGLPFVLQAKGRSPWAPSLDRTDPKKGYTLENVKVVVWAYNTAKGDWPAEDVVKLAKAILTPLVQNVQNVNVN